MTLINYEVPTDEIGQNANIKGYIFPDEEMQKFGFRYIEETPNRPGGVWRLFKTLIYDISLTVDIFPNGNVKIDVLDEDFLQPYDFQNLIRNNYVLTTPYKVLILVRGELLKLKEAGIIYDWNYEDYI